MADASSYNVVVLVEENLTADDAARVHSLHEGIEDPVAYHVLMPSNDGQARVQAAIAASGGLAPDLVPGRPLPADDLDPEALVEETRESAQHELENAVAVLLAAGATTTGELVGTIRWTGSRLGRYRSLGHGFISINDAVGACYQNYLTALGRASLNRR